MGLGYLKSYFDLTHQLKLKMSKERRANLIPVLLIHRSYRSAYLHTSPVPPIPIHLKKA